MTTQTLEWLDYSQAGELLDTEVKLAERLLGVDFPIDFVELMRNHQGMEPKVSSSIRVGERAIHVGSLMVLGTPEGGRNIPELATLWRKQGYPTNLVPFARVGGATHLALQYSVPGLAPTVVYLYPDAESEDTGFWAICHVAESVTEMVERIEAG